MLFSSFFLSIFLCVFVSLSLFYSLCDFQIMCLIWHKIACDTLTHARRAESSNRHVQWFSESDVSDINESDSRPASPVNTVLEAVDGVQPELQHTQKESELVSKCRHQNAQFIIITFHKILILQNISFFLSIFAYNFFVSFFVLTKFDYIDTFIDIDYYYWIMRTLCNHIQHIHSHISNFSLLVLVSQNVLFACVLSSRWVQRQRRRCLIVRMWYKSGICYLMERFGSDFKRVNLDNVLGPTINSSILKNKSFLLTCTIPIKIATSANGTNGTTDGRQVCV